MDYGHGHYLMSVSQARSLPRPKNWSGDLTDGYVNNFISFFK